MPEQAPVRVIAHRGRHDRHGENSFGAFRDAILTGADAAELDVRMTRDGVPVLAHDGIQWLHAPPRVLPWAAASNVRFLTRLEQVLAEPLAAGRDLPFVLDVKRAGELAAVAAFCLERADPKTIALWCREADALRTLACRNEFGEASLLPEGYNPRTILTYLDDAVACGASAVNLHREVISADLVHAAHKRGLRAYAFVRSPTAHAAAVRFGVDGLVTDWIDDARRAATQAAE